MKKLLLAGASVAAMAIGSSSYAADIAPVYKAPPPVAACANFGGFYVGVHGDATTHNWQSHEESTRLVFNGLPSDASASKTGWGGGAQAGWNWQRGCAVWGFEADWTWARINDSRDLDNGLLAGAILSTVESDTKWYGTVRTKAGVVVSDLMLYVTGGLAYARQDWAVTTSAPFGAGGARVNDFFTDSATRWGWTVGVGAEWALWNNWSIKSEVLYAQLQRREDTFASPIQAAIAVNPTRRFEFDDSFWVGRIGVNWRFGGGPIVARY